MSYVRVIPRDLFNDANLLKCLGALYIALETAGLPHVELDHEGDEFDIRQSDDDGSTYVANVRLRVHGELHTLWRPMNSRETWPLYIATDNDEVSVFDSAGQLSFEFRAFCNNP